MFKELSNAELMVFNGGGVIDDLGDAAVGFVVDVYNSAAALGQGLYDGFISKHGDVKPREYNYSR